MRCRPLCWFLGSGCALLTGILLIAAAIVAKTWLWHSLVDGVNSMVFTDNTVTTEGCSNLLFGDATCPGYQYEGWKMSTQEARDICLGDEEPSNDAIKQAVSWCTDCNKTEICPDGTYYSYYTYNVTNAAAVLDTGAQIAVTEMPPVHMKKWRTVEEVDRVNWDKNGIASYSERTHNYLRYPEDAAGLDTTLIVMPNYVLYGSIMVQGIPVRVVDGLEMVADWGLLQQIQMAFDGIGASQPRLVDAIDAIFNVSLTNLTRDNFFDGTFVRNVNTQLASGLPALGGLSTPALYDASELSLPATFNALATWMGEDPKNPSSDPAAAALLSAAGATLPPTVLGAFLYAQDNGCQAVAAAADGKCSVASPTGLAFPAEQQAAMWHVMNLNTTAIPALKSIQIAAAAQLLATNTAFQAGASAYCGFDLSAVPGVPPLPTGLLAPSTTLDKVVVAFTDKAQCAALIAQYRTAGRFALRTATASVPGYAAGASPYFVEMTLRQAIGFETTDCTVADPKADYQAPGVHCDFVEPSTGAAMSLGQTQDVTDTWTQQRAEWFGDEGIYWYTEANGLTGAPGFDLDCMTLTGATNWTTPSNAAGCAPNPVRGHELKALSGTLFGSSMGTDRYNKMGEEAEFFIADTFGVATLKIVELDTEVDPAENGKPFRANYWDLHDVSTRHENCDRANSTNAVGMDCSSPWNTINLNYHTSSNPATSLTPIYASLPYFTPLPADKPVGPYKPADLVTITKCTAVDGRDGCDGSGHSHIWTEPNSGGVVKGTQRLQFNARLVGLQSPTSDMLVPLFWADKYSQANSLQQADLVTLQGTPKLTTLIFILGLALGIPMLLVGCLCLFCGIKAKKGVKGAQAYADPYADPDTGIPKESFNYNAGYPDDHVPYPSTPLGTPAYSYYSSGLPPAVAQP